MYVLTQLAIILQGMDVEKSGRHARLAIPAVANLAMVRVTQIRTSWFLDSGSPKSYAACQRVHVNVSVQHVQRCHI
jgi:hypothetical protein